MFYLILYLFNASPVVVPEYYYTKDGCEKAFSQVERDIRAISKLALVHHVCIGVEDREP